MSVTKDIDIEKIKAKHQKYLDDMRKMLEDDKFMEQIETLREQEKNAPPKEIKPKTPEEQHAEAKVLQEQTEKLMFDFFAEAESLTRDVRILKEELSQKDEEIKALKEALLAIQNIVRPLQMGTKAEEEEEEVAVSEKVAA